MLPGQMGMANRELPLDSRIGGDNRGRVDLLGRGQNHRKPDGKPGWACTVVVGASGAEPERIRWMGHRVVACRVGHTGAGGDHLAPFPGTEVQRQNLPLPPYPFPP